MLRFLAVFAPAFLLILLLDPGLILSIVLCIPVVWISATR